MLASFYTIIEALKQPTQPLLWWPTYHFYFLFSNTHILPMRHTDQQRKLREENTQLELLLLLCVHALRFHALLWLFFSFSFVVLFLGHLSVYIMHGMGANFRIGISGQICFRAGKEQSRERRCCIRLYHCWSFMWSLFVSVVSSVPPSPSC